MRVFLILRLALVLISLELCSCQNPPQALPADARVAIRNAPDFPDYVWSDRDPKEYPTKPQVIIQKAPVYPLVLAGSGLRGDATIGWVIEPDGSTSHVQILEASNRYFGDAAKAAVEKWRFTSAHFQGRVVALRSQQLFEFREVK